MGVIIMSDKLQRRIRIYDPEDNLHMESVERELLEKVTLLSARRETHAIQFDAKGFRELLVSNQVLGAQERLGKSNVSLDIPKKTLVLHCPLDIAWLVTFDLGLPLPPSANKKDRSICPQCGDATSDIKFSTCGYVACRDCCDHQLQVASSDLTSNHFPLIC